MGIVLAHLVLEFYPAREGTRRWVILFHVFCKKTDRSNPRLIFYIFFSSPITYVNTIFYLETLASSSGTKRDDCGTMWRHTFRSQRIQNHTVDASQKGSLLL